MGNRIWRQSYDYPAPTTTIRKYIVDISAKLPTILCEIDSTGSLTKSYIYTDKSRILAQRNGGQSASYKPVKIFSWLLNSFSFFLEKKEKIWYNTSQIEKYDNN